MVIERIVDAHVHLWDPARVDWYPYLSGRQQLNMGDVSAMCRVFDHATYFSESAKWNVTKFVHVAAAAAAFTVAETMEREEQAQQSGNPAAIIGSIAPAESTAEVVDLLDRQMAASRFRGVRAPGFPGGLPDDDVLRALQERNLVFELMAHTDQLAAAASALAPWGALSIVIEHTGWPHTSSSEELAEWKSGMTALAALGDNVVCKISGLAMPLGSMAAEAFRPWVEHCLEVFGAERCMFASNFPVDGMHGTFDDLYSTYDALTAGLGAEARDQVFAATAERVYRC